MTSNPRKSNDSLAKFKFTQLNLNKQKAATDSLLHQLQESRRDFICAVQEPNVHKGRVVGFSGAVDKFHAKCSRPRSALICSRSLFMWFDAGLSSADITTCLWKTGSPVIPDQYILILLLMGITSSPPSFRHLSKFVNVNEFP